MEARLPLEKAGPDAIRVMVERVIWASEDSRFAILEAVDITSGREEILIGDLAGFAAGETLLVDGRREDHPSYGEQIRVGYVESVDPVDQEGVVRYLMTVNGIGEQRAHDLVERYPDSADVFDEIDKNPYKAFMALKGVGASTAKKAAADWNARRQGRELFALLSPFGLGRFTRQLVEEHGENAVSAVRTDPYGLTRLSGVGFMLADRLALGLGTPEDDPDRIRAAVYHVLAMAENSGHTYLPIGEVISEVARLTGTTPEESLVADSPNVVVDDPDRCYRHSTWRTEVAVAKRLRQLADEEAVLDEANDTDLRMVGGSELNPRQLGAVSQAFGSRLSVITGGPGVGKTRLVRAICEIAEARQLKAALCAPTGRAAQRLEQLTGGEAQTIHRLIGWRPPDRPESDESDPLEADMVICDESSMLSLEVAEALLDAIGGSTHLVLVGDADQLAAVGPGRVLAELIDSGVCPVTELNVVYRQGSGSKIAHVAPLIRDGINPVAEAGYDGPEEGEGGGFFTVLPHSMPTERGRAAVTKSVIERIPERFGIDPIEDLQVLSPMYAGPLGVDALNEALQQQLNPDGRPILEDRFRIGDKLLATKNDYEVGVRNGSLCRLVSASDEKREMALQTDTGDILAVPYASSGSFRLGYAATVHKAQGIELDAVVVVCHAAHGRMLSRELLYTAVTRARRVCLVVGDARGLSIALDRKQAAERHSALAERLRQQADG